MQRRGGGRLINTLKGCSGTELIYLLVRLMIHPHIKYVLKVTFHRAFDMSRDPFEALEQIIQLGTPPLCYLNSDLEQDRSNQSQHQAPFCDNNTGIERVLTSGNYTTQDPRPVSLLSLLSLFVISSLSLSVTTQHLLTTTQGHEVTCMEGLDTLRQLVECAGSRITVVPGGGITERNVHKILRGSGATEFHTSARVAVESLMQHRSAHVFMGGCLRPPEFTVSVAHEAKVASLISKSTHSSPQL